MFDVTFSREELDKLERKGRQGTYRVVDIETVPVVVHRTKMVVEDKATGKFYRGRFLSSSEESTFEEVEAVPALRYVPVDK